MGGACAVIYSEGEYLSEDADFILQSSTTQEALDSVLAELGFRREVDHYKHSVSEFFVEFPRGPLSIGLDAGIVPVKLRVGRKELLALSATDSCRDRLAAYYHWNDRQSLETAVSIALNQEVDLGKIRAWSRDEGMDEKFDRFSRELTARRRRPKR